MDDIKKLIRKELKRELKKRMKSYIKAKGNQKNRASLGTMQYGMDSSEGRCNCCCSCNNNPSHQEPSMLMARSHQRWPSSANAPSDPPLCYYFGLC